MSFCVFGSSSFISFWSCLKAALRTTLSSSKTAIRLFSSSIILSLDSTISEIAELFCCNDATADSSSCTVFRSACNARSSVDLAISKASSRISSSNLWLFLLPPKPNKLSIHEKSPPLLLVPFLVVYCFRRCSVMRKSSMAIAKSSASDCFSLTACLSSESFSLSSSYFFAHSLQRSCHSSISPCISRMVLPSAVQLALYSTRRFRSSAALASPSTTRSVKTSSWCL
mmetsp:Transcript_7583/g.15715  ORF Transcript_7583/g.15715 Transcript_7583/m.15715 type:complete len:227 (-) Transcript_7583:381-1061(-)